MSAAIIRPARPEDKDTVLAFTTTTFAWGDYIVYVWDEWLNHPSGELAVAELDGIVRGLSMATVLRSAEGAGEGWLQGLRVHPAYRRHGLARLLTAYQLDLLRRWGTPVVRLGVHCQNLASQSHVAQTGFRRLTTSVTLHQPSATIKDTGAKMEMLPASEAGMAWQQFSASPTLRAAAGLWARGWSWQKLTREITEEQATQGYLVGVRTADGHWGALAIACPDQGDTHIGYVDGSGPALEQLARALAEQAKREGREYCSAVLPPMPEICTAFRQAGYAADGPGASMYIYELAL